MVYEVQRVFHFYLSSESELKDILASLDGFHLIVSDSTTTWKILSQF